MPITADTEECFMDHGGTECHFDSITSVTLLPVGQKEPRECSHLPQQVLDAQAENGKKLKKVYSGTTHPIKLWKTRGALVDLLKQKNDQLVEINCQLGEKNEAAHNLLHDPCKAVIHAVDNLLDMPLRAEAASLVKTGAGRQRSGRQFRERMERQLGPDCKETLKQQRHARRHQTQPSIASGYLGAKARQFQKYVQRMEAHKKRKAQRRAPPPAAEPSVEMDSAAVEVTEVQPVAGPSTELDFGSVEATVTEGLAIAEEDV
uniref:Uncharacterized protein n=1 Tax=Globodera pallida TaxID=36090 RepID=A0A183C2B3_GLOPA